MAKENGGTGGKKKGLSKGEFFKQIADDSGVSKSDVMKVYDSLQAVVQEQLGPKGAGAVTLPGMFKITATRTKADKGGKKAKNPFTGEEYTTKPKPAKTKVKARGLKNFLDSLGYK